MLIGLDLLKNIGVVLRLYNIGIVPRKFSGVEKNSNFHLRIVFEVCKKIILIKKG